MSIDNNIYDKIKAYLGNEMTNEDRTNFELEIKYTRLYDESHNILPTDLHPDFSSSFNRQTVVKIEVKLNDINYGIGAFDMTFDKNVEPASGSIDGFQINWNNYPNNSAGSTGPVSYSRNKCAVFSASDNSTFSLSVFAFWLESLSF